MLLLLQVALIEAHVTKARRSSIVRMEEYSEDDPRRMHLLEAGTLGCFRKPSEVLDSPLSALEPVRTTSFLRNPTRVVHGNDVSLETRHFNLS